VVLFIQGYESSQVKYGKTIENINNLKAQSN